MTQIVDPKNTLAQFAEAERPLGLTQFQQHGLKKRRVRGSLAESKARWRDVAKYLQTKRIQEIHDISRHLFYKHIFSWYFFLDCEMIRILIILLMKMLKNGLVATAANVL